MRGGTAPDLLIDGVEVRELAHGGAGALLAGGGFLLLGRKVAPGEPRLLFLDRPRSRSWLPPPCGRLWVPSGSPPLALGGLEFPAQFYLFFSRAMAMG